MKIVSIVGSPRGIKGATAALLSVVLEGAKQPPWEATGFGRQSLARRGGFDPRTSVRGGDTLLFDSVLLSAFRSTPPVRRRLSN